MNCAGSRCCSVTRSSRSRRSAGSWTSPRKRSGRWPPRGCARTTGPCWSTSRRTEADETDGRSTRRAQGTGSDRAATMDLYPQPAAGQAKPWAFPAPDRGVLANGLTVLRCHRPRQQLVAVEICLDVPLDAEPGGLDGVARIMVNALSPRARASTPPRSSPPSWSAAARPSTRTPTTRARASRLEVPVSRLRRALGLLAEALRAPAFAESEVERLVRNRLDGIPHELANPGRRAAKAALPGAVPGVRADVPAPPGHRGDRRADRRGGRARLLRRARAARHGHRGRRRRPGRYRPGRAAGRHARRAGRATAAEPRPVPPVHRRRHRPGGRSWTGPAPSRPSCSSGGPAPTGTTGCGPRRCSARTASAARSPPGWTGCCARRRATPTGCGPSARCCSGSAPDGTRRRDARHQRLGGHRVHRPGAGRPVEGAAHAGRGRPDRRRAGHGRAEPGRRRAAEVRDGGASVAGTLADQVEQHLPDDYQAQLYVRLAETGTVEATAAAVARSRWTAWSRSWSVTRRRSGSRSRPSGIGEVTVVPRLTRASIGPVRQIGPAVAGRPAVDQRSSTLPSRQ